MNSCTFQGTSWLQLHQSADQEFLSKSNNDPFLIFRLHAFPNSFVSSFVPRVLVKMSKAKPKIPERIIESDDEEETSASEIEDVDSDEELQRQFAQGKLQPGLNVMVPYKKKMLVNNEDGLLNKLKELEKKLDWVEKLDLVNEPLDSPDLTEKYGDLNIKINRKGEVSAEEKNDAAQHDFKREMLFYRQAQAAILDGIPKLHKFGIKTKRPDDYFAQMLKTDDHMKKVQEHLNAKREALEKSEQAKKLREMKKMGKKIQQEVLAKRQKEKKELIEKVKAYKKGKLKDLDFIDSKDKSGGKGKPKPKQQPQGKNNKPGKKKENTKRSNKNSAYGYGGQKKRSKQNTAESSAQFGMKKKKGGKPQRPGKSRRQNMKGRK